MPLHKDHPCSKLKIDCTEEEWNQFQVKWQHYQGNALATSSSKRIIDKLWVCFSRTEAVCRDPTEADLLRTMRQVAVTQQNITTAITTNQLMCGLHNPLIQEQALSYSTTEEDMYCDETQQPIEA
jgi:hypothetical protein